MNCKKNTMIPDTIINRILRKKVIKEMIFYVANFDDFHIFFTEMSGLNKYIPL